MERPSVYYMKTDGRFAALMVAPHDDLRKQRKCLS